MDEMKKTDKLLLILDKAGWSVGDTAFVGTEGISWLVYGTRGELSLRGEGKSQEMAWKQACRQAEEMGLVQAISLSLSMSNLTQVTG